MPGVPSRRRLVEVGVRVEYSFGGGKVGVEEGCCCVGNCCDGQSAH